MGETLNAADETDEGNAASPTRPALARTLRQDLAAWRDQMFAELSWAPKVQTQTTLAHGLQATASNADGLLQPNGANSSAMLKAAKLGPGPEFQQFLAALQAFEVGDDDDARKAAAGPLRESALRYIEHWEGHSEARRSKGAPAMKKAACEQALADLRKVELAMQARDFPSPPWDSATESKALSLKATLDFESLPNAKGAAEVVGGEHANAAFWVNAARAGGDPTKRDKTFIFKPPEPKENIDGYPPGGDVGREALTARLGDIVRGMTGLDLQLPETNIVELDRENFPADRLPSPRDGEKPGRIRGSLQQFAAGKGDLQSLKEAERARMPASSCERIVIVDMLSLNTDRHSGNMMVGADAAGQPTLIPIDHGRAFPNREGLSQVVNHLGGRHSAVLRLPGAHQPFSAEAVQALSELNGDAMGAALRRERQTIAAMDARAGDAISDDSMQMSSRAADFLKLAVQATPPITAAAAQVALAANSVALFDPTLDAAEYADLAASIIARAIEQQDGLRQLMTLSKRDYAEMTEQLTRAGFTTASSIEIKSQTPLTYPNELMLGFRAGIRANPPIQFRRNAAYQPGDTGERFARGYTSTLKKVEAAGGQAALTAALKRLGIVGREAEMARSDPATALEIITTAAALDNVAQQVAGIDLDAKDLERSFARLDVLAKEFETGNRQLADVAYLKTQHDDGSGALRQEIEDKLDEFQKFLARKYRPMVTGLKDRAAALQIAADDLDLKRRREEFIGRCGSILQAMEAGDVSNIRLICADLDSALLRISSGSG